MSCCSTTPSVHFDLAFSAFSIEKSLLIHWGHSSSHQVDSASILFRQRRYGDRVYRSEKVGNKANDSHCSRRLRCAIAFSLDKILFRHVETLLQLHSFAPWNHIVPMSCNLSGRRHFVPPSSNVAISLPGRKDGYQPSRSHLIYLSDAQASERACDWAIENLHREGAPPLYNMNQYHGQDLFPITALIATLTHFSLLFLPLPAFES